jgi:hypothetical protein
LHACLKLAEYPGWLIVTVPSDHGSRAVPRKSSETLFDARVRKRVPVTVWLSPRAIAILEQMIKIEGAKTFGAERAIERALNFLQNYLEDSLAYLAEAEKRGRDPDALASRMITRLEIHERQ